MTKNKLKKAPHFAEQTSAPFDDVIVLAGSKAWQAWNKGQGVEWLTLCDLIKHDSKQKPVILGESQLQEINRLRLAPAEQKFIKLFQMGELNAMQQQAIIHNIAIHTEAQSLTINDHIGQLVEDVSQYIQRLRQDHANGESNSAQIIAESLQTTEEEEKREFADYFKTLADSEKLAHFLKWFNKSIRYDDVMQFAYMYTGKKWEIVDDTQLGRIVRDFYKAKNITYNKRKIENLVGLIRYEANAMGKRNNNMLGFRNGTLNKQTGVFKPHNERDFLTSFIDINYSEKPQPTPHFDKWLNWVSQKNESKKQRILAGLYMVLTNRHEWQLFLEITGAGGTGKSVFNNLAIMLAGEDNATAISLKELEDPRAREKLIDKTLFYSADQEGYIGDGAELRAITGGDTISINPKYKKPFDALISAVFMMTNNTAIIFKEHKGGIARRRVIFHFADVVPSEMRDSKLKEKLKAEAGGIVRLLLDSFKDPFEAKRLLEEQRKSAEALDVKEENDHILQFSKHFTTREAINGLKMGSNQSIGSAERIALYPAYLYFCDCVGYKPLGRKKFKSAFEYALKERNRPYKMLTRLKNNTQITNVFYIDEDASLTEWRE